MASFSASTEPVQVLLGFSSWAELGNGYLLLAGNTPQLTLACVTVQCTAVAGCIVALETSLFCTTCIQLQTYIL